MKELAREISREFGDSRFVVVSLLKGAFVFTADLLRHLKGNPKVDFLRLKSYEGERKGSLQLLYGPELPLEGQWVLLVDDIFDPGESLEFAVKELLRLGAKEVKSCVLLNKEVEKRTSLRPDFVGFTVPNYFVVGYGLDLNEDYRDLPFIGYFEGEEDGQI